MPAPNPRVERPRQVACGLPVVGDLGRARGIRREPIFGNRLCKRGVEPGALARQQLAVHGLLDEGVAKGKRAPGGESRTTRIWLPTASRSCSSRRTSDNPVTDASRADAIRCPAADATRRSSCVGSLRTASRASRTSRSVAGSSPSPGPGREQLLGVEGIALRAGSDARQHARLGPAPRMPSSWLASSSRSKRASESRSTRPERSSSASNFGSGCRP